MIQKGIVESTDNFSVKVRIPKYDKMSDDGLSYHDLPNGIICTPGIPTNYERGDIVLVGFENNEIDNPIILGLLYSEKSASKLYNIQQESTEQNVLNTSPFVHVRYSNDGGITLTSLYDYSTVTESAGSYKGTVSIDVKSRYIYASAIDKNGRDASENFNFTFTVKNDLGESLLNGSSVEIPEIFSYGDYLSMEFNVYPYYGVDAAEYKFFISTDRNPIGTTPGDFIGIYVDYSGIAPLDAVDYSWISIKERIQTFIDKESNSLLKRVQNIETYLTGTYEESEVTYKTGLTSALEVEENLFNISKKPIIKLSDRISLNTINNQVVFNNLRITAKNNGHVTID